MPCFQQIALPARKNIAAWIYALIETSFISFSRSTLGLCHVTLYEPMCWKFRTCPLSHHLSDLIEICLTFVLKQLGFLMFWCRIEIMALACSVFIQLILAVVDVTLLVLTVVFSSYICLFSIEVSNDWIFCRCPIFIWLPMIEHLVLLFWCNNQLACWLLHNLLMLFQSIATIYWETIQWIKRYISFISFLFRARPTIALFNYEITVSVRNNQRLGLWLKKATIFMIRLI